MINHDTLWKAVENKQEHYARLLSMPLPETVSKELPFFRRGMSQNHSWHFLSEPAFHWGHDHFDSNDLKDDQLDKILDESLGFVRQSGKPFMSSGISKEAIENLLAGFKGQTINKGGMIEIDSIPYPYSSGKSDISGFIRRDFLRRGLLFNMVPKDAQSVPLELDLSVPIQQPEKWDRESSEESVKEMLTMMRELKISGMAFDEVGYRPEQLEAMGVLDEIGKFDSVGCWTALAQVWGGTITNAKARPDGTIEANVTLPAVAKEPIVFEQKTKNSAGYSPQYSAYMKDLKRKKEIANSQRGPAHKRKTKVVASRKAAKAARKKRK